VTSSRVCRRSLKNASCSEEDESLLDVTFNTLDLLADNVEANGLGDWSALSDGDDITDLESESWGAVDGHSLMTLLESVVLLDVVEVITADDNRSVHLGCKHDTLEYSATDADVTGEGALLVDVGTLGCFDWSFEA